MPDRPVAESRARPKLALPPPQRTSTASLAYLIDSPVSMPPPSKLASSLSSKFSLSDETLYRLTAYLGTLSGTECVVSLACLLSIS